MSATVVEAPRFTPCGAASDPSPTLRWVEWAVVRDDDQATLYRSGDEKEARRRADRHRDHGDPCTIMSRTVTRRVVIDATDFAPEQASA